jgi:hypothetical protein
MKIVQAAAADSERLKTFFERTILPGSIDFSVRRPGSFFDHYRLLSDDFETLILTDNDDTIHGLGSLLFREGTVLGKKQTWGFATDLRIAPTRKAVVQWAQYFLPVLERASYERNCRYIFSAVEHHDHQAYNSLIRPTSHARRRLPRYLLANRFRLVTMHGRIPFATKPLSSIRLKNVSASDLEPLCAYLRERGKHRPLCTIHTPESLLQEIARWPGLSLGDFRIATDVQGRIRGCTALYDSRNAQTFIPTEYHGFAQTLHQTLWLASFTGLVRAGPAVNRETPVRFLSHLACDSGEIFHRLIDDAFSRLQSRSEILSYLHFRGNWRTLPPPSFVATSLPFGLYLILSPNEDAPPWPVPTIGSLPPEFEAAWL